MLYSPDDNGGATEVCESAEAIGIFWPPGERVSSTSFCPRPGPIYLSEPIGLGSPLSESEMEATARRGSMRLGWCGLGHGKVDKGVYDVS